MIVQFGGILMGHGIGFLIIIYAFVGSDSLGTDFVHDRKSLLRCFDGTSIEFGYSL